MLLLVTLTTCVLQPPMESVPDARGDNESAPGSVLGIKQADANGVIKGFVVFLLWLCKDHVGVI